MCRPVRAGPGDTATFYERYDSIHVHDPAKATVQADPSTGYRRTKLWLVAVDGGRLL
jgi:hypothetical protein